MKKHWESVSSVIYMMMMRTEAEKM